MSLIIPAAGSSSRYPTKPKWLLTCPNGNLMIQECIKGLDLINISSIYITILEEHYDKYLLDVDVKSLFDFTGKSINILKLKNKTKNQPETVYKTIMHFNIEGFIFIKDCDNYFSTKIEIGNYICYLKIDENNNVKKLFNKSFIELNENNNEIINICEKIIKSDMIGIGGYSFKDVNTFKKNYNICMNLKINSKELYLSHIILNCILNKETFNGIKCNNYLDWGTIEEWEEYKDSYKTLFLDIDGVLFKNCGEYTVIKWGDNEPIQENINHIIDLYNTGKVQIILTTARKSKFKNTTIKQLQKYGIKYHTIIFDLFHCKRYLINDYSQTNTYPSAIAINLKRDTKELNEKLIK